MTAHLDTRKMSRVQVIRPTEGLPPETGAKIYALANAIWPPEPGKSAPSLDDTLAKWRAWEAAHFLIGGEGDRSGDVLAHALIFRREILTPEGPLGVGALATVCVHPNCRGRGWGADVVRAAFDFLPELGVGVALFQTGVPSFYEKLGGRLVYNQFVNGDNLDNPFWDAFEMIHPDAFAWPDGKIDLNGPGY